MKMNFDEEFTTIMQVNYIVTCCVYLIIVDDTTILRQRDRF